MFAVLLPREAPPVHHLARPSKHFLSSLRLKGAYVELEGRFISKAFEKSSVVGVGESLHVSSEGKIETYPLLITAGKAK